MEDPLDGDEVVVLTRVFPEARIEIGGREIVGDRVKKIDSYFGRSRFFLLLLIFRISQNYFEPILHFRVKF
jgi:hypothetical protein